MGSFLITIGVALLGFSAQAAEISGIVGVAMSPVMAQLGPQFEQAMGHRLSLWYGNTGAIRHRMEAGETFDVAMFGAGEIDEFILRGKIAVDTRTEIARVGIGVGVRVGAPKPEIGSVDAFKRALISAKTIGYIPDGAVGIHLTNLFQRLGIAEQLKSKTTLPSSADGLSQAIVDGKAQLGFMFTNQLLSAPGVTLVGPLPRELQSYIVFTAAVGTAAKEPEAAMALIKFLTSPPGVAVIKAKGFDPALSR